MFGSRRVVLVLLSVSLSLLGGVSCSPDDPEAVCPTGSTSCISGTMYTCCGASAPVCCTNGPTCVANASQCGDAGSTSSGGAGPTPPSCQNVGRSQPQSAQCCPSYGVDACGAGLVCAALDGRTTATCYAEGSRQPGETCTVDALCQTKACNQQVGRCKFSSSDVVPCDPAVGCYNYVLKEDQVCAAYQSLGEIDTTKMSCASLTETTWDGCNYCITVADCESGQLCLNGICLGDHGFVACKRYCCAYGVGSGTGPCWSCP